MMRFGSLLVTLALWLIVNTPPAAADVLHHWIQLGPGGELIARVITGSPACPVLQVDGRTVAMKRRADPAPNFPELVCEGRLPQSAREILLEGTRLPSLKTDFQRIAVIGDTGCRIRRTSAQACNDRDDWPLRKVMAAVAAQKPDLVIHVGDYLYRFLPCPPPTECAGSSYGDKFRTWVEDWLGPAQQALSQTPFLFVRGNHETCQRAHKGWFRYFAVGPMPAGCPAVTAPWRVALGGLDLIVFDASDGRAPESSPKYLPTFRRMAQSMFAEVSGETWFLTHRPLWADLVAFGDMIDGDDTQRAAFGALFPEQVSLVLSGHIHAFQVIDLEDGPVQAISGNSGTLLDPMPNGRLENVEIAGSVARTVANDYGFGFLLVTRAEKGSWQLDAMDEDGKPVRRCRLEGRELICSPQAP